jgi:hypothetical protein
MRAACALEPRASYSYRKARMGWVARNAGTYPANRQFALFLRNLFQNRLEYLPPLRLRFECFKDKTSKGRATNADTCAALCSGQVSQAGVISASY